MSTTLYELGLEPEALRSSRLQYISFARFGADWHNTLHTHACTEIFYCVSGVGRFILKNGEHPVGSDDLVIVEANLEHTEDSVPSNPLEYIVLGIDGLHFRTPQQENRGYAVFNFREHREDMLFYLNKLLEEAAARMPQYETVCGRIFEVFLVELSRHTQLSVEVTPVRRRNKECAAVRRYIDEHFAEPLTLDALAELAHVNKYYLVHAFSKEYGVTPINYLLLCRIRESKHLLANTNLSLSQIAQVHGFSSPSYFSQSFRRLEGISPMEYRKRRRAEQDGTQDNKENNTETEG